MFSTQSSVVIEVVSTGTDLGCLDVREIGGNHPEAPAGIQTGKYWTIHGLQSDVVTPATQDYSVTLTLPHAVAPDANAKVCKYLDGPGQSFWDCDRANSTTSTVSRNGISALSDWAVGDITCVAGVAPDITTGLGGAGNTDVVLSWADAPANAGGYEVFRSTAPYFTADAGSWYPDLPAGATGTTDVGAAGSPANNHYYIVRGIGNCGTPSGNARRVGEFDFQILLVE